MSSYNPNAIEVIDLASSALVYRFIQATTAFEMTTQVNREISQLAAANPSARLVEVKLSGAGAGQSFACVLGFDLSGVEAPSYPLASDCGTQFAAANERLGLDSEAARLVALAQAGTLDVIGQTFAAAGDGALFMFGLVTADQGTVPPPGAVEQLELIPEPETPTEQTTTEPALSDFVGASFWINKAVDLNRIIIRVSGIPVTATALGRFLVYQRSDGCIGSSIPLVASFDFSATEPPSSQNLTNVLNEGTVRLNEGVCWALWGFRTGSSAFNLIAYNAIAGTGSLLSMNMVSGTHPVLFTTGISADTTPATLNPLEGGGDVTGDTNDYAAVWRTLKV